MQFACPSLFIAIIYFMTGQPDEAGRFFMCWGICLLGAFIGHFIGLIFGSLFDIQVCWTLKKKNRKNKILLF